MARNNTAYMKYKAGKELDAYLTQRAWNWLINKNYAIAADYVIHLLNRHSRHPLALMMGVICARHTNQEEFYQKCEKAINTLCYIKNVNNFFELLNEFVKTQRESEKINFVKNDSVDSCANSTTVLSPEIDEIYEWLRENEKSEHVHKLFGQEQDKTTSTLNGFSRDDDDDNNAWTCCNDEETIAVMESESLEETQLTVQIASERAQHETGAQVPCNTSHSPLIELRSSDASAYGRGLYTTQSVRAWTSLLIDAPCVVQRLSERRCAHCLCALQKREHSKEIAQIHHDTNSYQNNKRENMSSRETKSVNEWGIPCHSCHAETYCSETCREAAWNAYHRCSCNVNNLSYANWAADMEENIKQSRTWVEQPQSSVSLPPLLNSTSQLRASLSCLAVAKIIAMATMAQTYPLQLPFIRALRGEATYSPQTALAEIGSLAVGLSSYFRQSHLYMEEVLSLFAIWQNNEFVIADAGVALYPVLSLLNHSCTPNCAIVSLRNSPHNLGGKQQRNLSSSHSSAERELVALRDIRAHEQLFIDYNASYSGSLSYEDRKALCAQRHFECFCVKCVKK